MVAVELEDAAVHLVRTRLGDDVDDRRGVMSVPRLQRARLDAELLERIGERHGEVEVRARIVVARAIHHVHRAAGRTARDRNRHRRIVAARGETARRIDRDAGREQQQVGDLASIERQLQHALVVNQLANARAPRFDHRRIRLHGNLLRHGAEREHDVDRRRRVDGQHDTRLDIRTKTLERGFEPIRTDREVRYHVAAAFVRYGRPREAGRGLRDGDRHAWKHAAGIVLHGARDLCRGSGLRGGERWNEQKE